MKNLAYSSIFEITNDLISIFDNDGNIISYNKTFLDITGIDPKKSNNKIKEFHPDWAIKKITEEGIPYAQTHDSWTGETAILNQRGKEVPTVQTIISKFDGEEQINITIIKEEILSRNLAESEAERANEEKSLFLANMSHEIRTPSIQSLE